MGARLPLVAVLAALAIVVCSSVEAQDAQATVTIGTTYPRASFVGAQLEAWRQKTAQDTSNRLKILVRHDVVDDAALVRELGEQRLDGALLGGEGLGQIHTALVTLQMPGLFTSWQQLDAGRSAARAELDKRARDAGYVVVGWSDVGTYRFFSKKVQLKGPGDVQMKQVLPLGLGESTTEFFRCGGFLLTRVGPTEPLTKLGAHVVLLAPRNELERRRATSSFDTVLDHPIAYAVGAVVLREKAHAALPAELRDVVVRRGAESASVLGLSCRNADQISALAKTHGVVKPTAADIDGWAKLSALVRRNLVAKGVFPAELVRTIEAAAAKVK